MKRRFFLSVLATVIQVSIGVATQQVVETTVIAYVLSFVSTEPAAKS